MAEQPLTESRTPDDRILVLAPVGWDGSLDRTVLTQAGLACSLCDDVTDLLDQVGRGAGAITVTEEALNPKSLAQLIEALQAQPAWSELPLILLNGQVGWLAHDPASLRQLEVGTNLTLLHRPVSVASLVSVLRTALRARRRQYQLRDVVKQLQSQDRQLKQEAIERRQLAARLEALNEALEDRKLKQAVRLEVAHSTLDQKVERLQKTEMELSQERYRLRTLIDNMPDFIYVKDAQCRFVLGNRHLVQMLGAFEEAEILTKTDFDFFPAALAARYYTDDQLILHTGRPLIDHEEPLIDPEGRQRWLSTTKVPLRDRRGRISGLVGIGRDITSRKAARQERVDLLAALGRQHQQLRSLSNRLDDVQERERRNLARELHDKVGQVLTALNFNLGYVQAQFAQGPAAAVAAQPRLARSIELVTIATQDMRNVMAELSPPLLEEGGLKEALLWYSERFTGWSSVPVTIEGDIPPPRPALTLERSLFRIVQEALTNVAKHAAAGRVIIQIEATALEIHLTVADDGRGFSPEGVGDRSNHDHWGLLTMSERAEMINGRCWVEAQPGQGTRVIVQVPRLVQSGRD